MTASANRREVRSAKRELRRRGCSCHPRLDRLPVAVTRHTGAISAHVVHHRPGCPLGDRLVGLNGRGVVPVHNYYAPEGCDR